ncbi:MAG TPA: c-type cytochrome, partial [Methylophilaceae bacterium]|nr:c-type cytochrome [Methylophilaceae bacterium]
MASSVHGAEQPAVPKLATQICAACHGADGNSAVAMYPKIAGQFKPYTAKQLTEFKSGVR